LEQDAQSGNLDRLRQDLDFIQDATETMQRLLNDLLELSRIGRLMNPPKDIPFADVVHEALALVHGRLEANGIEVVTATEFPTVRGDRVRLIEVVQNLLDNATQFIGDQLNPRIEIGTRYNDNACVFYVQDNGIGIDPRYHEKVFELFEKLDPNSDGTGIGLALVKRIIEVHGGRIWVESEGLGHGSTFCFTLPRTQNAKSSSQ